MSEQLDLRLAPLNSGVFHAIVKRVAEIDEFKGWWSAFGLARASILSRLQERSITASARAAARIRGTYLAPPRTGRFAPRTDTRIQDQAASEIEAYEGLLRSVFNDHVEMRFDEALVFDFHRRLLRHTAVRPEVKGAYRTASASTRPSKARRTAENVALLPTAADMVPREMRTAVEWTASRLVSRRFHPLLVVAAFKLEFLAIRPFAHGNGRLSRILANLLLLQAGYAHVRYASLDDAIARRWTEYYLALRRSQANRNLPEPDISAWLLAFLDTLHAHATELRGLLAGRADERLLSRNQIDVLSLLERHGEVTNRFVCAELRLPRETVKQVLNRLVELNLVRRAGAGRAVRYTLVIDAQP